MLGKFCADPEYPVIFLKEKLINLSSGNYITFVKAFKPDVQK